MSPHALPLRSCMSRPVSPGRMSRSPRRVASHVTFDPPVRRGVPLVLPRSRFLASSVLGIAMNSAQTRLAHGFQSMKGKTSPCLISIPNRVAFRCLSRFSASLIDLAFTLRNLFRGSRDSFCATSGSIQV
jgi:hypothetical protein